MARGGFIRVRLRARQLRLIGYVIAQTEGSKPQWMRHFARKLLKSGLSKRGLYRPDNAIQIELFRPAAGFLGLWLIESAVSSVTTAKEDGVLLAEDAEAYLDLLAAGARLHSAAIPSKGGRPRVNLRTSKSTDERQLRRLKRRKAGSRSLLAD